MHPPTAPDHYGTLGVDPSAPHEVIRLAYRRLMRSVHPDVAGGDAAAAETAVAANTAWEVLGDPVARAAHDRARSASTPRPPAHAQPPTVRTDQQLREAAARHAAYSAHGRAQRAAFSEAILRVGIAVVLLGTLVLAAVLVR